ncbi:MAG TPA: hypothetical protein VF952_01460 [Chloroflexia bacterium]|jgi:hypothetical protein
MPKTQDLPPGTPAPTSGQYEATRNGKPLGVEITAVRGKRLPPPAQPGTKYRLVDATRHKRK